MSNDDILKQRWACLNCSSTLQVGELIIKADNPWNRAMMCPKCKSFEVVRAEGVHIENEYQGPIGTLN